MANLAPLTQRPIESTMAHIRKNVTWTDREMTQIARFMLDAMSRDWHLSLLQAVRQAQDSLGKGRQRNIQAWSMVEPKIGPKLEALKGEAASAAPNPTAEIAVVKAAPEVKPSTTAPTTTAEIDELDALDISSMPPMRVIHGVLQPDDVIASADQPQVPSKSSGESAISASSHLSKNELTTPAPGTSIRREKPVPGPLKSSPAIDPLQFEAALLVAFQSPVVERALADLMGVAMAQAFARFTASQSGTAPAEAAPRAQPMTQARVLVAGFSDGQAKAMTPVLEGAFEVRVWKSHQTPQMLEASARICALAIVPEDAPDDFQEHLSGLGLKVLRHEGGVGRLVERVADAIEDQRSGR